MNADDPVPVDSPPPRSDPKLLAIARKLIWWQPPEHSLAAPRRFLAQVMALGTWEDVQEVRRRFGEAALKQVLQNAPPGVFDECSWTYWHQVFKMTPVPPLPGRVLC